MIGIRREDKNRWEKRAPLTPEHVAELVHAGVRVAVQPSPIRTFSEEEYRDAGAEIAEDLSACTIVFGVKEIPAALLRPGTAYLFFAHVIKGQRANMPMLRRLMDLSCTLADYERIVDDRGRRLVFFGRHAGLAGMIDTLWALGRRLDREGIPSPFAPIRLAHDYADLEEARAAMARVAADIRRGGVPEALRPAVFGFTGSGNASRGAQEIFDLLPHEEVSPDDLDELFSDADAPRNVLYKVLFSRSDRIRRRDGATLDPAGLAAHPEDHESAMGAHLDKLLALVNGVYWSPGQPRVVSLDDLRAQWNGGGTPRLRVIGDVSCDLRGSIEATVRVTTPGDPVYVYDVARDEALAGLDGRGPVVLAVDNLPCEVPVDASQHFGDALLRFVPALARCDWSAPLEAVKLPDEIRRAVVVHRGRLTTRFAYLEDALAEAGADRR